MRRVLKQKGWKLIAGEYPGGSDHELYPLNVIDPTVARDRSPDPRRHSLGELIPDLVAIRNRDLLIAEAKVSYNIPDLEKLQYLIGERRSDLMIALEKFSKERSYPELLPLKSLKLHPAWFCVHPARYVPRRLAEMAQHARSAQCALLPPTP